MSEGDIFREVEEDMRRERLSKAFDQYGAYALGVAFIIIALAVGYTLNQNRTTERAEAGGAAFTKALSLAEAGKGDEAAKLLKDMAGGGQTVYRTLAQLELAAQALRAKDNAAASSHYLSVADDGTADPEFRDYATVQLSALQLETAPYETIVSQLGGLASGNSAWRFRAKELMALSAMKASKNAQAERALNELMTDADTPSGLRQRAEILLALLAGQSSPAPNQTKGAPGNADNAAKTQ
jgi:hypothetical protein